MALSPSQLQALVDRAGEALQGIQNDLGPDGQGGRVRFPRGYLKTVHTRIGKFSWLDSDTLKRNLCYHLLFSDVLRWVLNRTDLSGVARGMVVKHTIAVMGAVAESLTVAAMLKLGHGKGKYAGRVQRLFEEGIIKELLRDELVWLWDARASVHIYEVTDLELDQYEVRGSNRAIKAVAAFAETLNTHFLLLEFPVIQD